MQSISNEDPWSQWKQIHLQVGGKNVSVLSVQDTFTIPSSLAETFSPAQVSHFSFSTPCFPCLQNFGVINISVGFQNLSIYCDKTKRIFIYLIDNFYYIFIDTSWNGRESPKSFHKELLSASLKHSLPFTTWVWDNIYLLIYWQLAFVALMYFPFSLGTKDTANLKF